MAYNSIYTGQQVDDAVVKTDDILKRAQVWGGAITNGGVAIANVNVNPVTGDRTGTYDVIYSDTTNNVRSSSGTPNVSRVHVGHASQHCAGTNTGYSNGTTVFLSSVQLQSGNFIAQHYESTTASVEDWYIHEIWRLDPV